MKRLFLTSGLAMALSTVVHAAAICTLDTENKEFCMRMKHLRATVNVVDAQRELMVVNYPFMKVLADSLQDNAGKLQSLLPSSLADHKAALTTIEKLAFNLKGQAINRNPDALVTANTFRANCISCHSTRTPNSGSWNDVFGFDWDRITKDCNEEGRNPYLCKSMNGLFTDYNQLLTASTANIQNYSVTSAMAKDIARILADLKTKNFSHHLGEADRQMVEDAAHEVADLADARNPLAFDKAVALTDSCAKCHSNQASIGRDGRLLVSNWVK